MVKDLLANVIAAQAVVRVLDQEFADEIMEIARHLIPQASLSQLGYQFWLSQWGSPGIEVRKNDRVAFYHHRHDLGFRVLIRIHTVDILVNHDSYRPWKTWQMTWLVIQDFGSYVADLISAELHVPAPAQCVVPLYSGFWNDNLDYPSIVIYQDAIRGKSGYRKSWIVQIFHCDSQVWYHRLELLCFDVFDDLLLLYPVLAVCDQSRKQSHACLRFFRHNLLNFACFRILNYCQHFESVLISIEGIYYWACQVSRHIYFRNQNITLMILAFRIKSIESCLYYFWCWGKLLKRLSLHNIDIILENFTGLAI